MQSFNLAEVSDCGLLIVVIYSFSPFFPPFFLFFVFVCACVCVSLMYERAYLAIPCVSANGNVKHTKSNIRYDNKKQNVKYIRIHVYEYTEWMFASNLSYRDENPKYISKF